MTNVNTAARPARRRRRFLLVVLGLLLLVGGAFVGRLIYRDYANERLLREAIAEVEALDPHWRLEAIEAYRVVIPDAENSANIIRQVRTPLGRPNWPTYTSTLRPLEDLAPNIRLTEEQYQSLTKMLGDIQPAVETALSLADYPRGRHAINYAPDGISTLLPHADDMSIIGWRVFQPLLLTRIHEGDVAAALRTCRAINNLGRSIGDEPFTISQLVRAGRRRDAIRGLERLLGQCEVPEAALAAFQPVLADVLVPDPWEIALRGERAVVFQMLEAVRSGQLNVATYRTMMSDNPRPRTPADRIRGWFAGRFPPDTRPDEAWVLRYCNRLLETAKLPWPQRRSAVDALAAELEAAPELVGIALTRGVKFVGGFQYAAALQRYAVAALAVERYRLRHGAWPESLDALVPVLLPAVPLDPCDGRPLRYRKLADGVVIYSVGEDGTDNGGKLNDSRPPPPGTDLGFRLWDVPKRRQAPSGPGSSDPTE